MREGTREYERAVTSIEVYHLNYAEFVKDRRILAGMVERLVEELERLRAVGSADATNQAQDIATDLRRRAFYKRQLKELLKLIHEPDADYSAAALAYARAAIYKREAGAEIKRDWLADILNTTS